MIRTTLVSAWSRKRRLAGTALSVVLGVAFLAASLVLGDTARAGFETAFAEANEGTDTYVRSSRALTGGEEASRPPIPASTVDDVAAVEGVVRVTPIVEGAGQVLDAAGGTVGGDGPPTMAMGWVDDPQLTGWTLAQGRAPAGPDEVVIDRGTAGSADVEVGDRLTVLVPDPVAVDVVGIMVFGDEDSIGGTTNVAFTMDRAQELVLGSTDLVSGVVAAGPDGGSQRALTDAVAETLPAGIEALTGEELTRQQQEEIEGDFLGVMTTGLTAFALIALVVAAFSIFNTFSILAAQRTRESALLRAVGASRRQVMTSAVVESVIVGIVGAAVGAAAGTWLAAGVLALMDSSGFGLPSDGLQVSSSALVSAGLAGLAVTVAGGLVPALRSSRVAPLEALREVAVDHAGSSVVRAVAGVAVTVTGAAVMLSTSSGNLAVAGLGGAAVLAGVVLLGPVVARPVTRVLSLPLRLRGLTGSLARRNAMRNPRRTAASATALLVGVGVVSLFTVFGASLSRSIETQVDRSFAGDLALQPSGGGFSGAGLSLSSFEAIGELPETTAVSGLGFGPVLVDGRQETIDFTDARQLAAVTTFDMVRGDLSGLTATGLSVSDDQADERGYAVGDQIELTLPDGEVEMVTVEAVHESVGILDDFVVDRELWTPHVPQASYSLGFVGLADGVDVETGRAAVEAVLSGAGAPDVLTRDEFVESVAAEVDTLLTIVYVLLAIAVVIASMGIANTMSLAVHERTRELGLLRAVGQTRAQLRSMVRWESVVVSTFGAVGGLGLGMFLSWGLVRAMVASEGFGEYTVPVGSSLVIVGLGALVGLLAGLRPAWRASRLDVLDAIAAD